MRFFYCSRLHVGIVLLFVVGISHKVIRVHGFSVVSTSLSLHSQIPTSSLINQSQQSTRTRTSITLLRRQTNKRQTNLRPESKDRSFSSNQVSRSTNILRVFVKQTINKLSARRIHFSTKLRRCLVILCAAFVFTFNSAAGGVQKAHAAPSIPTASSVAQITRNIRLSPTLDQMVDGYVKDNMFDDDVYDPVESIYREAMHDKVKGTYPKALKEITSTVLGQDVIKAEKKALSTGIGGALQKVAYFLERRGFSESQAIFVLAATLCLGTPLLLLSVAMMVGSENKRGILRLMKKRYGQSYSVDATIKVEEDVELPDDDDDDDDDEDEDDDDEGDDEDK